MRKAFIVWCLTAACLNADQVASSKFRGLNNGANSVTIDASEAQDLENVDVSITGTSVKKRRGYGLYKAVGSGQPTRGGFHSYDSSGNDVQLWGSSTSLWGIVADGTPTQLVSSATLNSSWDCADTQQNSYCVDSSRDAFIKTNGTTMTWYTSPLGTMVETTPDRVVVAGVLGTPNTLYISQSNTFTNFTTGVNPTDAFTEVIASPGSKLTHIRWGCGKLLWWKDASFGYFDFDDQYTAQVKTVSDTIGTFDNTSAIDPGGNVWFRGQDGHTWKYDCSILTKESIDITPDVQASARRTANAWIQTTATDWSLGIGSPTVNISTSTSPGDVKLSTASIYYSTNVPDSNFENTSNPGWAYSSGWQNITSSATDHCTLAPQSGSRQALFNMYCGPAWQDFTVYVATITNWATASTFNQCHFYATVTSPQCSWSLNSITLSSSCVGQSVYLGFGALISPPGTYVIGWSSSTFISSNTLTFYSASDTHLTGQACPMDQYNFVDNIVGGVSASSAAFTYSTGTYYSAVHNAPNLASWSNFGAGTQLNDGTETFYIRSATNTFSILSSTPSWVAQNVGGIVSASTGTYFQVRDDFAITAATQTPTLNDFTVNWYEGNATDQAYMLYFDNAIWESVAFGAGQSVNNAIFKYDLINEGWTVYTLGTGGMLVQNNALYFGDPTAGNVFTYGTSTSDNGTAITAFWKSKDFTGPDPFLQTQLTNIDSFAKKDQGSALSVSYTMDTSTTTTYSMSLSDTARSVVQSRKLLPSGKLGQTFNVKYGDTSASSNWELLGYRIGFQQLPYRPTTP